MSSLEESIELFQCPKCRGDLKFHEARLLCGQCNTTFPITDDIPMLFWPADRDVVRGDVTEIVKEFYEETPFPNYDDFENPAGLVQKAREGLFARLLDEQIPPGVRILECGCGTGQMSNFLSMANRAVFATDICMNSLRLGRDFAQMHQLRNVNFVQMNLFRPAFKPGAFHMVLSNGVLHHTSDAFLAFKSVAELVRPGGYLLVGLYHRYGRLITSVRREVFRVTGDRFKSLDPNLRHADSSEPKRRAWFADQYKHPHESSHTIGEVLKWLKATGFAFVKSIPRSKPFRPFHSAESLFEPEEPGNALERLLVELGMTFRGSREGGFFIVIGRKEP